MGHIIRNLLAVRLRDQRTRLRFLIKWATQANLFRTGNKVGDESLRNRLLDDEPSARRAHLAGVDECSIHRVIQRGIVVGIRENDVRVLAAQLKGDLLHCERRFRGQMASGLQATRERHHVDARVTR